MTLKASHQEPGVETDENILTLFLNIDILFHGTDLRIDLKFREPS